MSEDRQFPRAEALAVANKFVEFLDRHCTRCVIAGSLRRRRPLVSDIEILFVSKIVRVPDPADMFGGTIEISAAVRAIEALLQVGVISKRLNSKGSPTWGPENKLAVHNTSGIPVDFFATSEDRFFNALFVRTGPVALNKEVAAAALARGWEWHAYGDGFTRGREAKRVKAERDVFDHVGLEYREPWAR